MSYGISEGIERLGGISLYLIDVLKEIRELIEGYVDVVDGPNGQPAPNKAMQATQLISQALQGVNMVAGGKRGR